MYNSYIWSDELYHYQVKGAKWYVRRYQNPDGSLTALGRIHYGIGKMREKHAEKKAANAQDKKEKLEKRALRGSGRAMRKASSMMTDEELKQHTARLNLEKQYKEALRSNQGGIGYEIRKITGAIAKKALVEAGTDALKRVIGVGTDKLVDSVKSAVNKAKSEDLTPKQENNQKQQNKQSDNSQKNEDKQKQKNKQSDDSQKNEKVKAQQNKKEKNKQTENSKKDSGQEQKGKRQENNKKQNSYDKLPKNVQETITRAHNQSKRAAKEDQFITFGNKVVNLSANRETATSIVNRALANQERFRDRSGQSFVPSSRTNKFTESRRLVNETLFENGLRQFNRKR